MTLSVQINRLGIGSHQLDGQKISPILKKRAEHCLSNYLSNLQPQTGTKELPFLLKLGSDKPTLQLGDRQISIENNKSFEPLTRLYRYYQHTGQLPRQGMTSQEESLRDKTTQKAIFDVNRAAIPGTNGHILAGMSLADDTLSVTRNILNAIPTVGPDDPIVNHLGYYAAMFWTFFAVREVDVGMADLKRSKAVGDAEGERRALARLSSGAICTTASVASLTGRICDSFVSAPVASGLLGTANILFGMASLLSISATSLGVLRCHRFNERLNLYLENKNLTEVEKLRGALQYLKDAVSVTPEEKKQMVAEIEKSHPDISAEEKEKLLQKKIVDLTEVKVKHLKRRTSNKSLLLILTQANTILDKLSRPATQAEGIKEATVMLLKIQKENKTKMALYAIGLIASLISFTAMMTMTFLSAGALPFVLYGIAGTIYLAISIYNIAGLITKKVPEALKRLDNQSFQDIVPLDASHLSL